MSQDPVGSLSAADRTRPLPNTGVRPPDETVKSRPDGVDKAAVVNNPVIPAPAGPAPAADDSAAVAEACKKALIRNMPRWPHQADGTFTQKDLDRAALNPDYHGTDAAALGVVIDNFEDLSAAHQGKFITAADIQGADLTAPFEDGLTLLKTASHKLFNGKPDFDALQQGGIGDCYYLAPLVDDVRLHPDDVVGMAKDNGKTVTITFPERAPVTVPKPTDAQLVAYSSGGANGEWPTVYEAAFEKSEHPDLSPSEEPGGDASIGINVLTGHDSVTEENAQVKTAHIEQMLVDAIANHKIVCTSTYDREYMNGLFKDHVYTVLGYDPKTQVVTIRNPHGMNPPTGYKDLGNGKFEMPLRDVVDNFEDLTYEK